MKVSKYWSLVVTLLLVMFIASTETVCNFTDTETSTGNRAVGFVPSSWVQTTATDFRSDTLVQADATSSPGNVVLGSASSAPGVFALVGGTSRAFYRYDIATNVWKAVASIPFTVGNGASLTFDQSRYVYATQGGSGNNLGRYDVLTDTWTTVSTTPGPVGNGGSGAWSGGQLYVLQGAGGRAIWRFDPTNVTWSTVTNTPQQAGTGASIVPQAGSLYVTRGAGARTFWRYSMSTSTWTTLTQTPWAISTGADLAPGPSGTLYASENSNQRRFSSYDIALNTWTTRQAQPYQVGAGGALAYSGGSSIYSLRGGSQTAFTNYDTTLNTWASLASVPVAVTTGGALVYVPLLRAAFFSQGTVTSVTFDTGVPGTRLSYAFWDRTLAASTGVSMEVRASDTLSGGAPNAAWQSLGSGSSASLAGLNGRYVQWRATLTTADPIATPTLQEVRIYYFSG